MTSDPVFPALPAPGRLVTDDPFWRYLSACLAGEGIAHLRMWEVADGTAGWAGGSRLAIVSETGLGASTTNSIEDIHAALVGEYGPRIVLLEHWPRNQGADLAEHLDQAVVVGSDPDWRRIWPTPPDNPRHVEFEAWMDAYGHALLAASRPTDGSTP